jgi:hypothetical protein
MVSSNVLALFASANQAASFARCLKVSKGVPLSAFSKSGPRAFPFALVVASHKRGLIKKSSKGVDPSQLGGGPACPFSPYPGYPGDMNKMLDTNPGLKSRFTHFIEFEDWSPEDCLHLFRKRAIWMCKQHPRISEVTIYGIPGLS